MSTKTSQTEAAVIIPTYTNTKGLIDALKCLKENGDYPFIVINNNPRNTLTDLKSADPTTIITENKNVGFAKACNDGAEEAVRSYHPEYLVFLNDDVIFNSDWIKACIAAMKKNSWCAAVPVLQRPDGSIENVGYRVLKRGKIELETDIHHTRSVDGITAAALVITTQAFKQLDGFDETFFAYLEDVDLCLRMKKVGMPFGVVKTAQVTHMGQQTSSRMSTKKAWLDLRNWIKLIDRHWSDAEKKRYLLPIAVERLRNVSGFIRSFGS